MTTAELLKYRLYNQHITRQAFTTPADLVAWMGAMQAQDYTAAKWALGLRLINNTDADIDTALADGTIIRTHLMRPTWHLVAAADVRWILELTAPRVKAFCAHVYRDIGLDDKAMSRVRKTLIKALEGGSNLTRAELLTAFARAKIATNDLRFIHIMMRAELEGIVCSGPRIGKQLTYALLDERVPLSKPLKQEEAIAKLAMRYFKSHGPATIRDFVWWSGLTLTLAKAGMELIKDELVEVTIKDQTFWMHRELAGIKLPSGGVYLLPAFDEYLISYTDRSAAIETMHAPRVATKNGIFNPVIVINGSVEGTWKRVIKKNEIAVEVDAFSSLSATKNAAIRSAARRYGKFMEMPVVL